jgi:hypothetical protein
VQRCKILDEATWQAEYVSLYGKPFRMDYKEEEIEVPPLLVYEREPRSGLFKFNPQKSVIPRSALNQLPDEFNRYSQADRDKVMRNMALQEVMDKLIR